MSQMSTDQDLVLELPPGHRSLYIACLEFTRLVSNPCVRDEDLVRQFGNVYSGWRDVYLDPDATIDLPNIRDYVDAVEWRRGQLGRSAQLRFTSELMRRLEARMERRWT